MKSIFIAIFPLLVFLIECFNNVSVPTDNIKSNDLMTGTETNLGKEKFKIIQDDLKNKELDLVCLTLIRKFFTSNSLLLKNIKNEMKNIKNANTIYDEITKYLYSNCMNTETTKLKEENQNYIFQDENKFASENLEMIIDILGVQKLDVKQLKNSFDEATNNKFDYLKETQISMKIRTKILEQEQSQLSKYVLNYLIGILIPLAIFFPIYLYKKLIKNENFSYAKKRN